MKKTGLIVLLAGLVSFGAFAQDKTTRTQREKPTPEKIAERQTKNQKEKLGLTDAQYDKVYAINLENAKKNQASMENRMATMKADREAYQAKLKEVLTAEQVEKLIERPARGNHGQMRGNNRTAPKGKTYNQRNTQKKGDFKKGDFKKGEKKEGGNN